MIVEIFGKRIMAYLRSSGYSQKELAAAMIMNPKVLSRKLNGTTGSYFGPREIHRLILILVDWQAITKLADLLRLLTEAEIDPTHVFHATEWQEPPLNTLVQPENTLPLTPDPPMPTPLHNLPASTTRLIGREWALARLQQALGRD